MAGPAFVAAFLAEGAARDDGYDPLRHPVSSLALGPRGGVQTVNFLVCGTLLAASGAAGRRVLIGAAGVGLVGAGVFVTDPVSGYPPGSPAVQEGHSCTVAALHDAFSVPVFLGLPVAAGVEAWRSRRTDPRWAGYSAATAVAMAVTFVGAGAGFAQHPRVVRFGGLLQRVSIGTGFAWTSAVALRALRGR
ncbi:DUF998 domain-containing protein [Pseudonocardia saturnea]